MAETEACKIIEPSEPTHADFAKSAKTQDNPELPTAMNRGVCLEPYRDSDYSLSIFLC